MPLDLEVKSNGRISQASVLTRGSAGALVMDADYRGLAVVRSLGRHGIPVWVLEKGDHLLAAFSRYNQRTIRWSSRNEEERVKFLIQLAKREGISDWVLFPTGDLDAALVARHHQILGRYFRLTTPPWDVLRWMYDKRLAYQLADSVGVERPWTISPANRDELATSKFSYPLILKPAYSSTLNRFTASKAWRVDTPEQLLSRYDEARTLVGSSNIIIQELIQGGGQSQFSYTALCQAGTPIASLTARRTRQFPMDFGRASTFVETVNEPEPAEAATRLLRALRYTGLVEVEFKRDPSDGKLKLLDINPRIWGWHSLCRRAGVDYPYLIWLHVIGEPVPTTTPLAGARWVRMSTDLPTAIREILGGRLSLRDYLHSIRRPLAPAIYASDDLLPGFLELPLLLYLFGKRAFRHWQDRPNERPVTAASAAPAEHGVMEGQN